MSDDFIGLMSFDTFGAGISADDQAAENSPKSWYEKAVPLLLPNLSAEYRPATSGPTRRNSAVAPEATARSHESL
jgi:hypothetical protein